MSAQSSRSAQNSLHGVLYDMDGDAVKKKWHLIVDVARCEGCNNCKLACKDEHVSNDWPGYTGPMTRHGEHWIDIPYRERGQFPLVDVAYRPTLCTHCSDAPCVAASGGIISKRPDGIVVIDTKKARGRKDLVEACPYGMIVWSDESEAPHKCTLCAHLLDEGWTKPRCVQVCGPGALSFVSMTDAEFTAFAATEGLETLHRGRVEDTAVCYKNLTRFTSCFVAGSVAMTDGDVVDCAAGATVTLRRLAVDEANGEEQTWELTSDTFGDFKFDGLPCGSGEYSVTVAFEGYAPVRKTLTLDQSVNVGTILLTSAAGSTRSAVTSQHLSS